MKDHTPETDAPTIQSLSDPTDLTDREAVPHETVTKAFEREQFEALRERYAVENDGIVQVGLTTSDGRLLLQGWDGASAWAPPGGAVHPDEDWDAAAREITETMTGVEVAVDGPVLLEEITYRCTDGDETFTAYSVSFAASVVDEDDPFLEDPTFDDDCPLADEDMALGWFRDVPDDANENHVDHIERFLEYA